jgi:SAM-dependent methyltransferase
MTTVAVQPMSAREVWESGNYDLAAQIITTVPAANLVGFAQVRPGERLLDVATGTGVVAITGRRAGAKVTGVDIAPALLAKAREHARIAGFTDVDWQEGDAQALQFADASFEVVVSQYGHMFAPDPTRTLNEMLRVLKPGGRIAFSTWPPESFIGRLFAIGAKFVPPPPGAVPISQWGDPAIVRDRLGARVTDLTFRRGTAIAPAVSPAHFRNLYEAIYGPMMRTVSLLQAEPARLAAWRADVDALAATFHDGNAVQQEYLMTRATKA